MDRILHSASVRSNMEPLANPEFGQWLRIVASFTSIARIRKAWLYMRKV